jgi:PadR family transcriptional regulator
LPQGGWKEVLDDFHTRVQLIKADEMAGIGNNFAVRSQVAGESGLWPELGVLSCSVGTPLPIELRVVLFSSPIELRVEEAPVVKKSQPDAEMLKGTLDIKILRTLVAVDVHGHTIAKVTERTSENVLEVEQGWLYLALHRLEDHGWAYSSWGASENSRKAKFYRLTAAGRKRLVRETKSWRQMARAIALVMGEETLSSGGAS